MRGAFEATVWNHWNRLLGPPGTSDDWDTDSGTSHAVHFGGRTFCGVDVGTIRDGWERNDWARSVDAAFVDCRRCRRVIEGGSAGR